MRIQFIVSAIMALLTSVPIAQADTIDDQYISALSAAGIQGDRGMLITDGHDACSSYGNIGIMGLAYRVMAQGYTNVQVSDIFMAGLHAYCPQHLGGI